MKIRRGYSLIEMLVVLTVGSALVGIAVTLLATVLHASRSVDDQVHRITTVQRLAEQFRKDAHAAIGTQALNAKGEADKDGTFGRRFDLGTNRTVTYAFLDDVVDRTEKVDQTVQSRDSFVLPKETSAITSTEATTDANAPLVALTIAPAPKDADGPNVAETTTEIAAGPQAGVPTSRTSLRIEAVVAKDHRFAKPE